MNKSMSDTKRIREIIRILIEPYGEMNHMTVETKLWCTIQPDSHPIYRRKVLQRMKVFGLWWMDEEQSCQYLWQGHKGLVIKSGQDPDRVMATRSFRDGGWCYVRENGEFIDLEASSNTMHNGTPVVEWMTCSITKEEYESLDKYLGPIDDGCKHTYEGMMG